MLFSVSTIGARVGNGEVWEISCTIYCLDRKHKQSLSSIFMQHELVTNHSQCILVNQMLQTNNANGDSTFLPPRWTPDNNGNIQIQI